MTQGSLVCLNNIVRELSVRATASQAFPVYSVTKHSGFVPSLEYFTKQVFSRNTAGYKLVRRDQFAYATIHLDEGALGLLTSAEAVLISPMYTVFEVDTTRVYPPYLYRALKSPQMISLYSRLGKGSVHRRKAISFERLAELSIPLPGVPEQLRISNILDKADAIRRKRQEAIALTEGLLCSAFLKIFGDPVTNPKGWPVRPLGEMVLRISDGTHKTPVYIDAGVPFLSAKNVRAHRIDWVRTKFISKGEHRELIRRCHPERGDVLLTKSGTIGEAAVVDRDTEFSLFESVALLKLKREIISPALVAALLNNPSVRKLYGADVKGVGVKHLHLVDLRKLPTICPPKPVQELYGAFENRVRSLLMRAERGCSEADSLFNSLVSRLFSGRRAASGRNTPR